MIKYFLFGLFAVASTVNAFSSDIDFTYVDSRLSQSGAQLHDPGIGRTTHSGHSIAVDRLGDFLELAKSYSVDVMFRQFTPLRQSTSTTTTFFFPYSGVIYSFNANDYRTLSDIQDSLRLGFEDGRAYYHAKQLGVASPDEYEEVYQSWFLGVEDFRRYSTSGFAAQIEDSEFVVLPERVSSSVFDGDFLRILARHMVSDGYELHSSTDAYQTLESRGLLARGDIFRRNNQGRIVSQTTGMLIRTDLPFFDLEFAVELVHSRLRQGIQHPRYTEGSVDLSGLSLPPYRLDGNEYILPSDETLLRWGNVADGVIYYFSRWNGAPDPISYSNNVNAQVAGFNSIDDHELAKRAGFTGGADYYAARDLGFDTFFHFDTARAMNLMDRARYEHYRAFIDTLLAIKVEFELDSYREALIMNSFVRLEPERTVALQRIADAINDDVRSYGAIRNVDRAWGQVSEQQINRFIARHDDVFERIGSINTTDAVFTRR